MIRVRITHHRDDVNGGHLVLMEAPWWIVAIDSAVGSYNPRFGWDYQVWSAVLNVTDRKHRELYKVRVDDFCEVSAALWGTENHMCWRTNCPYDLHQGDP